MVSASDVVIWSADVPKDQLMQILRANPGIKYVKIDRAGIDRMGFRIIRTLQEMGYFVFDDAKIIEVPDKVIAIAAGHLEWRPWMLNCMAGIVSTGHMTHEDRQQVDALKRFADFCHTVGTLPCAVTVLTSKTAGIVEAEFRRPPGEQVLEYVELLFKAGFTDVVCSPGEVELIRRVSRFDSLMLNTPSVRMPGSSMHDQARVATPVEALRNGANRLVIGRDLTDGDFTANFERIAAHLQEV